MVTQETKSLKIRGYTLIEAILASFLLLFTFFMVGSLFQTGMRYSTQVESRITAVNIAENTMADLRAWARTSKTWSGFTPKSDPANAAYTVTVKLEDVTLFSPSRELEVSHTSDRRAMKTVAKRAVVTVTSSRSAPYRLVGIVTKGEPKGPATVKISGEIPNRVGPNEPVQFTAQAFDADGEEIPDIFFHWAVEPVGNNPSTARIIYNGSGWSRRDGSRAVFRNQVQRRDGTAAAHNGNCKVQSYVRLNGRITAPPGQTPRIKLVES